MTRIIRVKSCRMCPFAFKSKGCREVLCIGPKNRLFGIRQFEDTYPKIPDWCPLEEEKE